MSEKEILNTKIKDFITYEDAAKILNMSVSGVKLWARDGLIKRYSVTKRCVFVRLSEILALIEKSAK